MTSTPPARFQLWHPTRGISFSPTPKAPESPFQEPLVIDEKVIATTNFTAEHNLATGEVCYPELPNIQPSTPGVDVAENNAIINGSGAAPENVEENTKTDQKIADLEPPPSLLDFKIDEDLFYAAKKAPPGSPESYWSYTYYRGPPEDGKPRNVKVHYCRSKHKTEEVLQKYFMNEKILGFDLEWSPWATKEQDIRENVSLIQLASTSRIALFHVALFPVMEDTGNEGFVAPSFKKIMEDPGVTKLGVCIKGDATRVRKFMDIDSRGLLELSHLYKLVTYSSSKQYKNINKRPVTLAKQVEDYLRLPLFKGSDVRSSNWSRALSMDQIIYSASDAYAGLHLYATLEHHRKQLNPCPPTPHHAELDLPIRLTEDIELESSDEAADTPEPIAPATPALSSDYIASVLETIKVEDLDASSDEKQNTTATATPSSKRRARAKVEDLDASSDEMQKTTTTPSKRRARTKPPPSEPKHPYIVAAEDRATCYQDAHPEMRASFAQLRAYYLWYNNELEPKAVARLVRDPPLQESSVIGYVLSVIKYENLPYNQDRLRDELAIPLPPNLRPYWPLVMEALEGET